MFTTSRAAWLFVTLIFSMPAHADFVVSQSGTGTAGQAISATAILELTTHNFGSGSVDALQITLTNTSATTSYRGNLLTGFFFSLDGVVALPTAASGFDGLAATVRTSNTASISNVDIAPAVNGSPTDGTYQLSNGPFGTANSGATYSAYEYGIGTVGYGLTGFSGAATDGDTYGIAAAGSDLTLDGLPSALPVIDTSAVFWIVKPVALMSLSQLTIARFAFGSLPDNALDVNTVPEPTSLALMSLGLVVLGVLGLGRRSRGMPSRSRHAA